MRHLNNSILLGCAIIAFCATTSCGKYFKYRCFDKKYYCGYELKTDYLRDTLKIPSFQFNIRDQRKRFDWCERLSLSIFEDPQTISISINNDVIIGSCNPRVSGIKIYVERTTLFPGHYHAFLFVLPKCLLTEQGDCTAVFKYKFISYYLDGVKYVIPTSSLKLLKRRCFNW
jgi:hypothetical protein